MQEEKEEREKRQHRAMYAQTIESQKQKYADYMAKLAAEKEKRDQEK